ncbi:MAG TPA: hypothetical protein VK281_05920 [Xanthobacteraceae bacterium]|nr:hypothetical protein [Xanthobacteraceae bacterium]
MTNSDQRLSAIQAARTALWRAVPTVARAAALFVPLLILGSTESLALGTRAERAACTPDAVRLCSQHFPNVGRVVSCMRSNRANLSEACRTAMDRHESPGRQNVADGDRQSSRSIRHRGAEAGATTRVGHRYHVANTEPHMLRRHRGGLSMAGMGQFISMVQPYMGMIQPYIEPYMGTIAPYMSNLGGLGGLGLTGY